MNFLGVDEMEKWKDIKNYEGYYQISNFGQVRSLDRYITNSLGRKRKYNSRFCELRIRNNGYVYVELSKDNIAKKFNVHRLVAIHFINNPNNKPYVNHINGDKKDNHYRNLEWVTERENTLHAYENGLMKKFHRGRRVVQVDMSGLIISDYKSIGKASKITGIQASGIRNACEGVYRHAGGYKWFYAEDNHRLIDYRQKRNKMEDELQTINDRQ